MNIQMTSGAERRARDLAREAVRDAKKNQEQVARERSRRFQDKIGPAVEFAQDMARGRLGAGTKHDAGHYQRYYFPKGY